jgi:hypothetical protein
MRVYTNIPEDSPTLLTVKKLLGERNIEWMKSPGLKCFIHSEWNAIWEFKRLFIQEKIAYCIVTVDYEFEGRVDRGDLRTGNYTCEERLRVEGFTKRKGEFQARKVLRTKVSSSESSVERLTRKDWERIFEGLNSVTLISST